MATTVRRSNREAAIDGDRVLQAAVVLFTAAVLFHNGDHVRRGAHAVASDVFWVGSLSILLEVAVVAVVVARHRVAPLLAAATGFGLAVGYVLVHALPARSWLSDPLFEGGAEGLSQAAAALEIVAALALGAAGAYALRQRGGLASVTEARPTEPWARVLTHPAVLAMALGNVLVLVLSFADR